MSSPAGFRITTDMRPWFLQTAKIEGGLQRASAGTLTSCARAAHGASMANIRKEMIVRNKYTIGSMVFYPASPAKPISRQNAVTGTRSPYLPVQETGGKVKGDGGAIPVPTDIVRGKDRAKKIPARLRMNRLGEFNTKGSKYFVLRPARPARILKRAALFYRKGKKIIKVRDMGANEYRLRATYWHTQAVRQFSRPKMIQAAWIREAKRELGSYTKA